MDNSNHVGIWKRDSGSHENVFFRDKNKKNEFLLWARNEKIPPKKEKWRIALIGESVARGFMYDPYLTPAMILEKSLNVKAGKDDFEVVDLAKTSIGIEQLIELCEQSVLLEPDVIIVFAGNNWLKRLDEFEDSDVTQILTSSENIAQGIADTRKRQIENDVNHLMNVLSTTSKNNNIPIMFMVPAVNLVDWTYNLGDEYFPLQTENALELYQLKNKIEQTLSSHEYAQAEEWIEQLIEQEPNCATGYGMKAKLLIEKNYDDSVIQYKAAHDTDLFMPDFVPGCISYCQNLIKDKASELGFMIVNIPERFKENFPGNYSGNDLFVDYCHLSYTGMHNAMHYAAEAILSDLKYENFSSELILIELDKDLISKAHFFAAIHCSHWGTQSYDLLYYHCKKAIEASLDISHYMKKYIKLVTTEVPWCLNKDYFDLLEYSSFNQYPSRLIQNDKYMKIDLTLVNVMRDVMYLKGIDIRDEIHELRLQEFSLYNNEFVNLLQPQFSEDSYIKYEKFRKLGYRKGTETAFIRLIDCVTKYNFIAGTENDLEFVVLMRAGSGLGESCVDIAINDTLITSFELDPKWKRHSFIVPSQNLNADGIQHMKIKIGKTKKEPIEVKINNSDTHNIWHVVKPLYAEIMTCQFTTIG